MFRVVLISNDPNAIQIVRRACAEQGGACSAFATAADAQDVWERGDFELLVLDGAVPELEDFSARLNSHPRREAFFAVLLLEAQEAPQAIALLRGTGADDCVVKPLELRHFDLRIAVAERALRRKRHLLQACESLRETAEQLSLAAAGTHDGFWHAKITSETWFDPSQPVWFSPQMKALLGFADHELSNVLESWAGRLHPDDLPRVFQALEDHMLRRVPYDVQYRMKMRGGEYRWFRGRGQALWDAAGQPTRFAGSMRDVTEQHLSDAALRESESRHRLIAETVNDIIWEARLPQATAHDATGGDPFAQLALSYVSPAIERVLGYTPAEACRIPLRQWISPASFELAMAAIQEELRQEAEHPEPARQRTLELEHVTKSGTLRNCEVTAVFLRDSQGKPIGILGVSRDVTERKQAEAALLKERALLRQLLDIHERERQLFAYELHDGLVQHLTASLMHLEVFDQSNAGSAELIWDELNSGMKQLQLALSEGRRLISGLRPPILDEYGIVAAIEYLIQENREALPELTFHYDTRFARLPPPLENALFRVAQEALSNVRRHGGRCRARVELTQFEDRLRLEVIDWGVGFHPDQVAHDRFGLQGIRERIRLLGGQVTIDSAPGRGTRVTVELPLPVV